MRSHCCREPSFNLLKVEPPSQGIIKFCTHANTASQPFPCGVPLQPIQDCIEAEEETMLPVHRAGYCAIAAQAVHGKLYVVRRKCVRPLLHRTRPRHGLLRRKRQDGRLAWSERIRISKRPYALLNRALHSGTSSLVRALFRSSLFWRLNDRALQAGGAQIATRPLGDVIPRGSG